MCGSPDCDLQDTLYFRLVLVCWAKASCHSLTMYLIGLKDENPYFLKLQFKKASCNYYKLYLLHGLFIIYIIIIAYIMNNTGLWLKGETARNKI